MAKTLRQVTLVIAAGQSEEYPFDGNYIRVKTGPFDVQVENIDSNGRDVFELVEGEEASLGDFSRLRITNLGGAEGTFKFFIGNDTKIGSAKTSGSVSISNTVQNDKPRGNMVKSAKTVTTVNSLLFAANPARRFLAIQNKHTFGTIWVRADGSNATQTISIEIKPGEEWAPDFIPLGGVYAFGDVLSNALITGFEG